jgi:crotonobetaine/carnitine-CoA ligase
MTDLECLPAVGTVSDLVRLRAQTTPDRAVLRFHERSATYRELDARAAAISRGLAGLGVGRGHRVAVLLDNSVHAVEAWVALARLRVVEVPVNPALRGESLAFPLRMTGCEVLVTSGRFLAAVNTVTGSLPALRRVVLVDDGHEVTGAGTVPYSVLLEPAPSAASSDRLDEPPSDDAGHEASVIMFSSGTTGPAKGVVLTHAANFALARGVAQAMGYDETDVLYNVFPLSHVNARFTTVLAAMLVNATAVVHRRFSASRFWATCRQEGVTAFNYMGTMSALLLAQPPGDDDRDHGARKAYGSGTVGALREQFRSRFGVAMVETYGSTELGMVTHTGVTSPPPPGSCGRPVAGYTVSIQDRAGRSLAAGDKGEITVRPQLPGQMFSEYFDNAPATVQAWRDLWFHTGDRGYLDEQGWLYFVDRLKDTIRRRGENISSWEVERTFLSHPAVAEACAVGIPSVVSGEEVLVALVLQSEVPPAELLRYSERDLPYFAVPRYVRIVESLPKTPSSRVEKYKVKADGITEGTWDRELHGFELSR